MPRALFFGGLVAGMLSSPPALLVPIGFARAQLRAALHLGGNSSVSNCCSGAPALAPVWEIALLGV